MKKEYTIPTMLLIDASTDIVTASGGTVDIVDNGNGPVVDLG